MIVETVEYIGIETLPVRLSGVLSFVALRWVSRSSRPIFGPLASARGSLIFGPHVWDHSRLPQVL